MISKIGPRKICTGEKSAAHILRGLSTASRTSVPNYSGQFMAGRSQQKNPFSGEGERIEFLIVARADDASGFRPASWRP
jgi:hypothetical protein